MSKDISSGKQSGKKGEDAKLDKETLEPLPLWKLFRYASCVDGLLLLGAVISSATAGMAIPLVVVVIGLAITEFGDFIIANAILSDLSTNVTSMSSHFCGNSTFTGFLDYFQSSDPDARFQNQLYNLSFGMLAIAVGYCFFLFLSNYLWSLVAVHQEKRIKVNFVRAVLKQDTGFHDLHNVTELPKLLIDDIVYITNAISNACGEIVYQMSSALVSFVIALYFNWILGLVVNSLVVLLFIVLTIFGQARLGGIREEQHNLTLAASLAEQVILAIRTVIAYGGQSSEEQRYEKHLKNAQRYSYISSVSTSSVFSFFALLFFSMFALGFWYGTQKFIDCTGISVGDIVIVIYVTVQLCLSSGYLVIPLDLLKKAGISGAVIYDIIDNKPEIETDSDSEKTVPDSFNGDIEFSDVVFSYPSRPDVQILHGLDLTIKSGQTVALVGSSGSGKSTVMKLIPRIYEFIGGRITLDGHDIRELSVKWLRHQIGIVSQEPDLFNVSIAENIAYGKEGEASQEEIEAAAETANAHDFITALPDGYRTIAGEGGSQISGGQKQRIAIARALISNPKILLLDEATSALDTKSEKLVQQALDKAREGRTTIIIAHRLSSIQNADVIVGIDKGCVVEMGSHSELMDKQGLYYKLVMNQTTEETEEQKGFSSEIRKTIRSKSFVYRSKKSRRGSLRRKSETGVGGGGVGVGEIGLRRGLSVRQPTYRKNSKVVEMVDLSKDKSCTSVDSTDTGENPSSPSLAMTTGEEEELYKGEPVFSHMMKLLKQEWWMFGLGIFFYCLIGIQQCTLYILMSQTLEVFSRTDANSVESGINFFVYWFIGLGFVGAFLYIAGTLFLDIGSKLSAKRIRHHLFRNIINQEVSFFDRKENAVSNLLTNLTESPGYIAEVTGVPVGFAIRVLFAALSSVVISLYASWVLALILLPSYIVVLVSWILDTYVNQYYLQKATVFVEDSNNIAIEAFENHFSVTSLAIAERITAKFDGALSPSYRYILLKDAVHGLLYSMSESSVVFTSSAALATSGVIFVLGESSVYYATYNNIFLAIASVLFTAVVLKDGFASLTNLGKARISGSELYLRLLDDPRTKASDGDTIESMSADISAKALFFSYPSRPEVSVLKGLDLSVQPGKTLALVGPSGSGKSTIVSLLEKFYLPTLGELLVDDKDIREFNTAWLRQQIALVSQEPILFDMSVADNIRYGANFREVTDEEIQEAAKSANIHEFIISLPDGYNTDVGLGGSQMSGGQKQRIAIARALVRNPKILLLDEATSALDTESERVVQEALDKASEGRTTIVIAHRLSTIQNADCICVLHRGRVIEKGTHSELMSKQGAYYLMKQN